MGAFEELSRVTLSPKQRQVSKRYGTIMWPSRTTQIFSNNAWFDGLFYVDFTPTAICLWNSTWSKSALKRLATSAALIRRPRCPQKSTGQSRSVKCFYLFFYHILSTDEGFITDVDCCVCTWFDCLWYHLVAARVSYQMSAGADGGWPQQTDHRCRHILVTWVCLAYRYRINIFRYNT